MRVLVADDDRVSNKLVCKTIEKWGYEVISAKDGNEAITILTRSPYPELAVLDWEMPGRNAPEICWHIKSDPISDWIYIIVLTSRSQPADLVAAIEAGADDFLTKPFDPGELRVRLRAGQRVVQSHRNLLELNQTLENRVQERTAQLEDALRAASAANEAKSVFLANMSHEIRTPLNGIISYLELLGYSELSEEQQSDLETIEGCVEALRTIINDILDLSKIEADKMVIERIPFSVKKAVADTVHLLERSARAKEVTILEVLSPGTAELVLGDTVRVKQVVTNLVANAIKFCTDGGFVIVQLFEEETNAREQLIHLAVSDTGIGIPHDKQSMLFRPFQQADDSTTRRFGGTGLGLTICKRLTELMGGTIWFESLAGVGTTFHVRIPFDLPIEELKPSGIGETTILIPNKTEPSCKVLLADDNVVNQVATARILRAHGHHVTTANTGIEVLYLLRDHMFDIVLMDIQMPQMGGDAAAEVIRTSGEPYADVPIIALTANGTSLERERFLNMGFNEFCGKPIVYGALLQMISSLVGKTRVGTDGNGDADDTN